MKQNKTRLLLGSAALVTGLGFLAYGLLRGEARIVLDKAINVCMQCIGLG